MEEVKIETGKCLSFEQTGVKSSLNQTCKGLLNPLRRLVQNPNLNRKFVLRAPLKVKGCSLMEVDRTMFVGELGDLR